MSSSIATGMLGVPPSVVKYSSKPLLGSKRTICFCGPLAATANALAPPGATMRSDIEAHASRTTAS